MKWTVGMAAILLSGCASSGGTLSAQQKQAFETFAPVVANCKTIQKEYTDLSMAPPELLKDKDDWLPPQRLIQVWVMTDCPNNERVKIDVVADGRGGGVLVRATY